jgi:hypothetical protein
MKEEIRIERKEDVVWAHSPYNPSLPTEAKKLGGRWEPKSRAWKFNARDEVKVRELYKSIYGTDGTIPEGDLVTLECSIEKEWSALRSGLFLAGRQVAYATGRDSGAKLAHGVIIVSGEGFKSGGSFKNWRTIGLPGTTFEVRDVPRSATELPLPEEIRTEILEQGKNEGKDALEAERKRLLERVAEIDQLLSNF